MTDRKPDYVFNIGISGEAHRSRAEWVSAKEMARFNKIDRRYGHLDSVRPYRVLVYLKDKRQ